MAQRIDHRNVRFPNPSNTLINRVAIACYQAFAKTHEELDGLPKLDEWSQLGEQRKMVWREVARSAFGTLAKAAGAKFTKV